MHSRASEWRAVVAASGELTALRVRSAEVDGAVRTARQHIGREQEASRTEPERTPKQARAARIAPVAGGRLRQDQPTGNAGTRRSQAEPRSAGGKWRELYTSHFPVLGSIMIAVPLFILAAFFLLMPSLYVYTPIWAMLLFGLAGIAGSLIDYRNGCGAPLWQPESTPHGSPAMRVSGWK
jgi:hypothetical protein